MRLPKGAEGRETANRSGPLLPARPYRRGGEAGQTGDRKDSRPDKQGMEKARGPGERGRRKARGRGNGRYLGSEHHHRRRTPYERRKRRTRGESREAYSQGKTGRS
ncbi:hypothetical protein HMPREF9004_0375 [Schaalia cardiffensis F0333]|uniref:Uncharacterized protein n=1 Tax=Schaalia cardiffensis F0333 TaxID=888050 RepID=N6W8Z9_9ACTO|nr:hypothetical protein HMPREF9004_0375 [Schaalia cardiffensis F0333]